MSEKILALAESDDLSQLATLPLAEFDAVLLAFWASPEFAERMQGHGAKKCWRLNDWIADYPALVTRAFVLAHGVAEDMPMYRGVNPWRAWENVIANALLIPLVLAECHTGLRAHAGADAEIWFLARSDMQRAFEIVNRTGTPGFETRVASEREASKTARAHGRFGAWRELLHEARHEGDWKNLFAVPLEALDADYRLRARLPRRAPSSSSEVVFYSSYINYSRALATHAEQISGRAQWVVNAHSARKGLPPGTSALDLHQFGVPQWGEHAASLKASRAQLADSPECVENFPLRAVLAANHAVRETSERVMPRLLAEIDLMTEALARMKPREVWVANQWGGEGCFLQVAHVHKARVTQVQHGVLEPYYGCAPLYSDALLVWSDFWRACLPLEERAKTGVTEGTGTGAARAETKKPNAHKRRVTFFTSPPEIVPLWNPSVAAWEIVTLLRQLAGEGYAVTLRAHPMDRVARYEEIWQSEGGGTPPHWDKGTPLDTRLAETDAAVMMFSTTALDCATRGIPVTGLGWYEFVWKKAVQEEGTVRYSESIPETVEAVRKSAPDGHAD